MNYRREIDGLRALAIIPVIFFHAGFPAFGGGFVGVDVFFVISGYLITSIIISDLENGTFSLIHFYERRARRILPALFLVIMACLPLAWMLLLPYDMKSFSQSLVAVSGFASNILFYLTSGYFDTAAELKPLLHTWSLAVEEQYYLVFPLLLLLLWRLEKNKVLLILVILAIFSLAFAQFKISSNANFVFYMLPTRGWELLIGSLIAFYLSETKIPSNIVFSQFASTFGFLLIAYSIFSFDSSTTHPSVYTLIPTFGAALIILYATPNTFIGKLLGYKYCVGIGLISYSAYLWHHPLFSFARLTQEDPDKTTLILLSLFSIFLAYFSWRYVEVSFRNRDRFNRNQIFVYSLAGIFLFASIGIVGHLSDGFKSYYHKNRLTEQQGKILSLVESHANYDMYDFMFDDNQCRFWDKDISNLLYKRFESCVERFGKAVLVIGDSHAMNLYNIIAKSNVYPFVVGVSQGYCRITDDEGFCLRDSIDGFLVGNSPNIKTVVYHQNGKPFFRGKSLKFDEHADYETDIKQINKIINYFNKRKSLAEFVWVGPWVEAQVPLDQRLYKNNGINLIALREFKKLDSDIKYFISEIDDNHRVSYYSVIDELGFTESSLWVDECLVYRDKNHLSRCGEDLVSSNYKSFWGKVVNAEQ